MDKKKDTQPEVKAVEENDDFPVVDGKIELVLSDGRKAIIRETNGKDVLVARKLMHGDEEKYLAAMMSIATTVDDVGYPMEIFPEQFKSKDFTNILLACSQLNF